MTARFQCEASTKHGPFSAAPACIRCARTFAIDTVIIAFYVGAEALGFLCPACMAPDAWRRFAEEAALERERQRHECSDAR